MFGKLFKVTSFTDENCQLVVYVEFLGRRYIWKNDVYMGWYKA